MTEYPPNRPLISFTLFAYNQERYISEAVAGAFSQNYEPMELILSDDCSTDRTFEIMQEMAKTYKGPHEVRLRRNEINLGVAGHVNAVFAVARGDILLLAAGDDVSLPNRTKVSVDLLNNNTEASAVLLSAHVIDESGKKIGQRLVGHRDGNKKSQSLQDLIKLRYVTFGATRAIRSEVFKQFGPLNNECPTEDTPLLLRSLIYGKNIISQRKLILYRKHQENLSSTASLSRMNTTAIYTQYRHDIAFSEKSFLISGTVAKKLRKWLDLDQRMRQIRLQIALRRRVKLLDAVFLS